MTYLQNSVPIQPITSIPKSLCTWGFPKKGCIRHTNSGGCRGSRTTWTSTTCTSSLTWTTTPFLSLMKLATSRMLWWQSSGRLSRSVEDARIRLSWERYCEGMKRVHPSDYALHCPRSFFILSFKSWTWKEKEGIRFWWTSQSEETPGGGCRAAILATAGKQRAQLSERASDD